MHRITISITDEQMQHLELLRSLRIIESVGAAVNEGIELLLEEYSPELASALSQSLLSCIRTS